MNICLPLSTIIFSFLSFFLFQIILSDVLSGIDSLPILPQNKRNIFNFTVRYLNNSLETLKTLLDGILVNLPIVPSAIILKVYYMLLQTVSCLGIFGRSADSFIDMCNDWDINKNHFRFITRKTSNIIIRSTHFIFCSKNKPWTCPDLISF